MIFNLEKIKIACCLKKKKMSKESINCEDNI